MNRNLPEVFINFICRHRMYFIISIVLFFFNKFTDYGFYYLLGKTDINKAVFCSINGNNIDSSTNQLVKAISNELNCNKYGEGYDIYIALNPELKSNICWFINSNSSEIKIENLNSKQIQLINNSAGPHSCIYNPSIMLHCTYSSNTPTTSKANITIGREACRYLGIDTNLKTIVKLKYKIVK